MGREQILVFSLHPTGFGLRELHGAPGRQQLGLLRYSDARIPLACVNAIGAKSHCVPLNPDPQRLLEISGLAGGLFAARN